MNVRRYIAIATFALGVCGTAAYAQEEGFTKQIEVQKEYEVVVRSAERIEGEVALLDTTIVRPELSYRIRPTAHLTNFATSSLRPISIATAEWAVPHKLYLNVGGGVPLQSEADLYWSPVQNSRSQLSLWLNHEGTMGKVTNLSEERIRATTLRNMAGVKYSTLIGKRTSFSAGVNYRGTLGDSYGGVGVIRERPFVGAHDLDANMNLAGDFGKNSPLGYDANAMGLYAWNSQSENVWRFNLNFGLLGLNKIKGWLPERVTLHYSGVQSRCLLPEDDYYDTSITFVPEWKFRIGKWIPVEAMVGYDHMIYKGAKNSLDGVIASLSASFDRSPYIAPYLTVANDVQTKVTRDGLWRNPYMTMLPVDSRKVFLAEVGFKGILGNFIYKLSGSSRWFSSYFYEVAVEGSPLLTYGRSGGQRVWYADAEMLYRPSERLSVEANVGFTSLGKAESSTAYYSPRKWRVEGNVRWQPMERLSIVARCEWRSAMEITVREATADTLLELPSYVDLGLSAEWLWNERLSLWLRGDNLLGQPIYHWATYRAPGAGFRLGARMSF